MRATNGTTSPNINQNGSPRSRRRSSLAGLNNVDPHHHRQPSLGELHQQLENEQEAQVNRLLHMIRVQQEQIAAIQRGHDQAIGIPDAASSSAILEPSSPPAGSISAHGNASLNRPHSHSVHSASRHSIVGNNSRGSSPSLRPVSGPLSPSAADFILPASRDESTFYQAETQTLTRENQMLKQRIRELERQISELGGGGSTLSSHLNSHGQGHSPLASPSATNSTENIPSAPTDGDTSGNGP
ncbi:Hypothetical protein R9X50_00067600 [Acrodontium crateriforme]|uniref:Uncharacterized protein n=1 Tax=Acrodontium crateriforme TaxID=150365 RepID=A0AAQ3LXZ1_9PEZI|nr:Hypothetical protein R9X50_00067600 [Acrodontium crateriforme]